MGRSHGTHVTVQKCVQGYRGTPWKKSEKLKYLSLDARIILKWIIKKQEERIWNVFSRFGIRTSSNGKLSFGQNKTRRSCWVPRQVTLHPQAWRELPATSVPGCSHWWHNCLWFAANQSHALSITLFPFKSALHHVHYFCLHIYLPSRQLCSRFVASSECEWIPFVYWWTTHIAMPRVRPAASSWGRHVRGLRCCLFCSV
jgi:hypothetical protein